MDGDVAAAGDLDAIATGDRGGVVDDVVGDRDPGVGCRREPGEQQDPAARLVLDRVAGDRDLVAGTCDLHAAPAAGLLVPGDPAPRDGHERDGEPAVHVVVRDRDVP